VRFLTLSVLASFLFAACGGGGTTPPPPPVGDGTFTEVPATAIAVGDTPTAIASGDFNQDGVLDLAVGAHNGDRIDVLIGQGDGTYAAAASVTLPLGSRVFDMRVARLDAGSTLDLVVSFSSINQAMVFHGGGDGTFTQGATLTVAGGDDAMGIAVGTFDPGPSIDIAVVCRDPGLVGIFLNDGTGVFASPLPATFSVGFEARGVVAGLFDGDGELDLAVSVRNSEQVELYLGSGNGTFAASSSSPTACAGQPWTMAVADFDQGSGLDIVMAGENTDQVTMLLGDGAGALTASANSPIGVGDAPIGVATGDFNGDGAPDLVVANLTDGTLSILLNDGMGALVPGPQATITVGLSPFALVVADLNGDGIEDIAVANQGDDTVTILLGDGA